MEGEVYTSSEFADFLCGLSDRHPISSIEDGMHEEDWEGWKPNSKARSHPARRRRPFCYKSSLLRAGIEMG